MVCAPGAAYRAVRSRPPADAMTFDAYCTTTPMLPSQPWRDAFEGQRHGGAAADAGLDPALLEAGSADVAFALDGDGVETRDVKTRQWNTTYVAEGDVVVRGPGGAATTVPGRYEVSLRNEDATPAAMASVNPFDPATIPPRARIEVHGADDAGTALEPAFRELAAANELASIDDLRLSLEMTEK